MTIFRLTGTVLKSLDYSPAQSLITLGDTARVAVVEQRRVALGQGNGELLEEVANGGGLLLPGVPGKRASQLLDLADSCLVPCTKALYSQGQEDNALGMTRLPRFVQLALVSSGKSMTRGLSSLTHKCSLQGVDNCDIKGTVFTPSMPGDEDISWLASLTWEKVLPLLSGSECCLDCSAKTSWFLSVG